MSAFAKERRICCVSPCLLYTSQYGEGDAAKSQSIAENYITQGVVGIFGCNEGSTTGAGNAIKAAGNADIIGVGFDKSDAILNLIDDGYLLCTMAQKDVYKRQANI